MNDILLWGTGLSGIAEQTSPDQFRKMSPAWAQACDALEPWTPISLIAEEEKSRCWISGQNKKDTTLLITGPCSSAMDVAWHFHRMGILPEFGSVLAVRQWAGRGRFGRAWHSPVGNLYGAWRLPAPENRWGEMLSLVVGFVVLQTLKEVGVRVQLKWPNDLIVDEKKIGGILVEQKNSTVVAGIGINVISSPERSQLRDLPALSAASLKEYGIEIGPLELWRRLIDCGKSLYGKIMHAETDSGFISRIQDHMAFVGHRVLVYDTDGGPYEARLTGLDSSGRLRVCTSNGQMLVGSGSIHPITESLSITKE